MDGRSQRVKEIFDAAADAAPADRAGVLDRLCAGDAALRADVEGLLGALEHAGKFLGAPTGPVDAASAPLREGPGARIGQYKLLQQLGEGGFGVVFMAEQEQPVRRRVALKIIKLGMDTHQVIARFEAERQALAMMDHPNIARVLDAGATETGRPYFVMELVKGDVITAYADKNRLTISDRLALFTQVCQAVHHAHQKGIIHRDIKPTNVLVSSQDGRALAKVIDFGIAKATDHRLTERTLFTEHRQLIGTPEYMSPEQAEGSLDIDTRTDVYALGVLLYELLTGSTPFEGKTLRSAAFAEIQRIIREVEPPKPSTRLSRSGQNLESVAASRHSEPKALGTQVRGDMDWIVMKALEKDRARRYESASALAADVARHLAGDAVDAAPPSTMYRARKFVRRHKGPVFASALIGLTLIVGVAGTTWGMVSAERSRDDAVKAEHLAVERFEQAEKARAEAERAKIEAEQSKERADRMNRIANAVTEFFTHDVLNVHPVPEGQPEVTVRELLDAVPAKIDQYFKDEPAVEGIIRERVGELYRRLGDLKKSESYLRDAIPLLEKGLGPENKSTLSAIQRMGEWLMDMNRFDEAVRHFDKAYQGRLKAYGMEYNLTVHSLGRRGTARVWAGQHEEGLRDVREAWEYQRQHMGEQSRGALNGCRNLAECLLRLDRPAEARDLLLQQLELMAKNPDELQRFDGVIRELLGSAFQKLGEHQNALTELDKALAWARDRYPPTHAALASILELRAEALAGLERRAEARQDWETAYSISEAAYGAASDDCVGIAQSLVDLAVAEGNETEAQRWRSRLPPG